MLILEIAAGIVLGWLSIGALRGLGRFVGKYWPLIFLGLCVVGFGIAVIVLGAELWTEHGNQVQAFDASHPYLVAVVAVVGGLMFLVLLAEPHEIERFKRFGRWVLRKPEPD